MKFTNVHITAIPDYTVEQINQIVGLLNEIKGEINFIPSDPFDQDQLLLCDDKFHNFINITSLSFDDLFNIASKHRVIKKIAKEDFVIVLTPKRHNQHWFSGTINRNIFVDTNNWEYITENDSKYGIAYQIIENIFQSLIGIDYDSALTDPNVHFTSKGCINDMCAQKTLIISKLRSGYICMSCQERAIKMNVSKVILLQIVATIQRIRDGLMNFDLILKSVEPHPTIVSEGGDIKIGENKIDLQAIPKTLFVFFLSNLNGVKAKDLKSKDNQEKLLHIYRTYRQGGSKESIEKLCLPHNAQGSTFAKNKWDINSYLITTLDKILSEFYLINLDPNTKPTTYKIKLPERFLTFNLKL